LQKQQVEALTPYDNFLFALKAKETKRQYPHRLDKFLSYLGLEGTIEQKCIELYEVGKDVILLHSHLIHFINLQKERIEENNITEGTLCNYIKGIKLFCSMNDIIVNWMKIGKGMPAEKHSADDRIPTLDEINKLVEHPDRRVKLIVLTMISSGIRVGSFTLVIFENKPLR
jgi:hypothetical protein